MKYLLSLILFFTTACGTQPEHSQPSEKKSEDQFKKSPPPSEELTEVPPDQEIVFELVSIKILQKRCTHCHSQSKGNRGGVNLEDYTNVALNLRESLNQVSLRLMPTRGTPMTTIEESIFSRWAELGAPE